jgi:hypothetical protein
MNTKPYVWQMIKEAVECLGGKATYSEIKDFIRNKYGEVNESTINCVASTFATGEFLSSFPYSSRSFHKDTSLGT